MRKFDNHGIIFKVPDGPVLKIPQVHNKFADLMSGACLIAATHGIVKIGTLGFIYSRAIRGGENKCGIGDVVPWRYTSRHSEGMLMRIGRKDWKVIGPWQDDNQKGCRAFDLACDDEGRPMLYTADNTIMWTREQVIDWLERNGFRVQHKRKGSISPDHLHIEYPMK